MDNLITLDEYKVAKGLSKNDKDDQLNFLIGTASSIIQTYINRDFIETGNPITETFSLDYDAKVLYLGKYPVTNLVSLVEIDPTIYAYDWDSSVHVPWLPPETPSYYLDSEGGRLIRTGEGFWPQGPGAITVTYTAGVVGGVTEVPAALKQVTIDLVSYYLYEEYKPSKATRGTTMANNPEGFRSPSMLQNMFPPHIQRILDMYK